MRNVLMLLLTLAPALAPALAFAAPKAKSELLSHAGKATVGQPAPWFAGWTPEQRVFNLKRLKADTQAKGHVLLFFATWCAPCEAGLAQMVKAKPRLEAAGVKLVLVNFKEEATRVVPWLNARGLAGVPVLLDEFGGISEDLAGVGGDDERSTLPRTVVINSKGEVTQIIGAEGQDFVDVVLRAARP